MNKVYKALGYYVNIVLMILIVLILVLGNLRSGSQPSEEVSLELSSNSSEEVFLDQPLELVSMPLAPEVGSIQNPYEGVDWDRFGQYKAAFHSHTNYSDGRGDLIDVVLSHYNKYFDILAITDHDVLNQGWDVEPVGSLISGGVMSAKMKDDIISGSYSGYFPDDYWYELRRPQQNGMISITNAVEHSKTNHVVSFWSEFLSIEGITREEVIENIGLSGGVAFLAHIGRYTGGSIGGEEGYEASNYPSTVSSYVELFKRHPHLVGMEIYNSFDRNTKSDKVLWDNILGELMKEDRPVWGFASDDSHYIKTIGFSWNVMLLDFLDEVSVRESMESGAFYTVSRIDYSLGINADFTEETLGKIITQPTPSILSIECGVDEISIKAKDYERIEWVADGEVIYTGEVLDLVEYEDVINSYVRAQIISTTGVAMTQPFGISFN